MMIYYAKLIKAKDGYCVEFPDLEGCLTCGDTKEEALTHAKEALEGWLASCCDHEEDIPDAVPHHGKSYYPLTVDATIAFPIYLKKLRKLQGWSPSYTARRLGLSLDAYKRLETAQKSNPSMKLIERICDVFDAELELKIVA